jgi:hypothetical protein
MYKALLSYFYPPIPSIIIKQKQANEQLAVDNALRNDETYFKNIIITNKNNPLEYYTKSIQSGNFTWYNGQWAYIYSMTNNFDQGTPGGYGPMSDYGRPAVPATKITRLFLIVGHTYEILEETTSKPVITLSVSPENNGNFCRSFILNGTKDRYALYDFHGNTITDITCTNITKKNIINIQDGLAKYFNETYTDVKIYNYGSARQSIANFILDMKNEKSALYKLINLLCP